MIKGKSLIDFFTASSGAILILAAAAKLFSATGNAGILQQPDPVLSIAYQHLFWIAGGIELVVGGICLFGKNAALQTGLIAWLATCFLAYRGGMVWIGVHKPCPCLGTLTEKLHLSPELADTLLKIVLAYLLLGSYGLGFWLWKKRRQPPAPPLPAGTLKSR